MKDAGSPAVIQGRAEASSVVTKPREPRPLVEAEEDPGYGCRWVEVETAEGPTLKEVPLTWEDLFDPQEGDYEVHSSDHGHAISETKESLRCFFRAQDDVAVFNNVKMLWADPKIAKVAPDISVIPGVKDKEKNRSGFDEKKEGTRPVFVLEVLSKATAKFDKEEKPAIYHSAKVQEYFLLDPLKKRWKLTGYHLVPGRKKYQRKKPDERGRWLARTLGVQFSITPDGQELIAEDAATGDLILKPIQEFRARKAAKRVAAQEAEARKAAARNAEAEARRAAERVAAQEAEARKAAEADLAKLRAEFERLHASRAACPRRDPQAN